MMGGFAGIWQWVIVLVIVLILFGGRGKIARLMGDLGKGISSFKRGIKTEGDDRNAEDEAAKPALKSETADAVEPAQGAAEESKAAKG